MHSNEYLDVYENLSKQEYIKKANVNNKKVLRKEVTCTKCKSKYIDIIDCDEYNLILRCLCLECGEPFTVPIDSL